MSNEKIKEYLNKSRMKGIEAIPNDAKKETCIELEAPTFGLDKWRKEHGLISPAMEAYIEACREQKALLVIGVLLITIIVNYLKYGVP